MRLLPLLLLCALLLAACGGGDDARDRGDRRGEPPGERAGDAETRVIRGWTEALAEGDVDRAASFFAVPSRVQNGTPVLTLRSRRDAVVFNEALPCGAVLTDARSHAGFVITRVRLTERPGGSCGSGVGGSARNAIRVEDGKIVEWYRLPDAPGSPLPPDPGTTDDPELPVV